MYQEGVPRGAIIFFFYMSSALLLLCPPTPEHVPPPLAGRKPANQNQCLSANPAAFLQLDLLLRGKRLFFTRIQPLQWCRKKGGDKSI